MASLQKDSAVSFSRTNMEPSPRIVLDVEQYGFEGEYVGDTEFNGKLIEGNALNITGSYVSDVKSNLYTSAWCRQNSTVCPYQGVGDALFSSKNAQIFTLDDIVRKGSCQPEVDVRCLPKTENCHVTNQIWFPF